jgi:hypothetical protein
MVDIAGVLFAGGAWAVACSKAQVASWITTDTCVAGGISEKAWWAYLKAFIVVKIVKDSWDIFAGLAVERSCIAADAGRVASFASESQVLLVKAFRTVLHAFVDV